jgi:hypothetical protein
VWPQYVYEQNILGRRFWGGGRNDFAHLTLNFEKRELLPKFYILFLCHEYSMEMGKITFEKSELTNSIQLSTTLEVNKCVVT